MDRVGHCIFDTEGRQSLKLPTLIRKDVLQVPTRGLDGMSLTGPTMFSKQGSGGDEIYLHDTHITILPDGIEVCVTSLETGVCVSRLVTDPVAVMEWRLFAAMLRCTREGACPVEWPGHPVTDAPPPDRPATLRFARFGGE